MKKEALIAIVAIIAIVGGYFIGMFFPVNSESGTESFDLGEKPGKGEYTELESELDTFAYGTGLDLGIGLNDYISQFQIEEDFPLEKFMSGFQDGMNDGEGAITQMQAQAEKNLTDGQDFLAENAEREEVNVTPSGLQYEILTEGTGASPAATDTVVVHYHGTLIDGTVFDSSVDRGQPATFPVNQVISGWTEALQLMKTGSKWKLYIPSDLAYGNQQRSAEIQANSTLIFEVELLEIKGK